MIIFIPVIAIVIFLMLIGGIQPGGFITLLGLISLIVGLILLGLYFKEKDSGDYHDYRFWAPLLIGLGIILWLFGSWFGEHSLFEFLFGTGWF